MKGKTLIWQGRRPLLRSRQPLWTDFPKGRGRWPETPTVTPTACGICRFASRAADAPMDQGHAQQRHHNINVSSSSAPSNSTATPANMLCKNLGDKVDSIFCSSSFRMTGTPWWPWSELLLGTVAPTNSLHAKPLKNGCSRAPC
jgi:hypothetical protein